MKHTILKKITFSFGIMLMFAVSGFAQIQGGVFDQKKQGIPNANVMATDTTGKVIDTVKSDKRGFYIFKGLRPGKYKIEAKALGFLTAVFENIQANKEDPDEGIGRDDISSATRLEIVLKPANVPK